jgi:peptide/nickel transport system permease protein
LASTSRTTAWRAYRRNPLAMLGLVIVVAIILSATLADVLTPYPEHVGPVGDFSAMNNGPSGDHWFGTDTIGRDLLTRIIYGYRLSLTMAVVVLSISAPIGVVVGLVAGYSGGWLGYLLMRATDVFLSIPPLVLAMSIMGFLEPTLLNGMLAVTAMWWPWYARLVFNVTRSEAEEGYVLAAETIGASTAHILFLEILPNCWPSILTKITLDVGFVVLMVASLSFLGLGVQPPTPDLGSMVADGAKYMPDSWWLTIFPALAILLIVLGFNLLGDGLREAFDAER